MARTFTCKRCGVRLSAENDEALIAAAQEHFEVQHKLLPVSRNKIRETVLLTATDDAHPTALTSPAAETSVTEE